VERRCGVDYASDFALVLARQLSDELPHLAVAD
jgi:hypothetical protein